MRTWWLVCAWMLSGCALTLDYGAPSTRDGEARIDVGGLDAGAPHDAGHDRPRDAGLDAADLGTTEIEGGIADATPANDAGSIVLDATTIDAPLPVDASVTDAFRPCTSSSSCGTGEVCCLHTGLCYAMSCLACCMFSIGDASSGRPDAAAPDASATANGDAARNPDATTGGAWDATATTPDGGG